MYLRGLDALIVAREQTPWIGSPVAYLGGACPSGMIATKSPYKDRNGNLVASCATMRPAAPVAPAPAPAPQITVSPTVTVSPAIQTSVSPQISPGFIQSSGGGTQSTGAQQTQGGQNGSGGGSGLTADQLASILTQQEKERQAADAEARKIAAQQQAAALAQQQATAQAQIDAMRAQADKAGIEQKAAYEAQIAQLEQAQKDLAAQAKSAQQTPSTQTVIVPSQPSEAVSTTAAPETKPPNYAVIGISIIVVAGVIYFASQSSYKKRGH
jgi:hypothetical protein